MIVERLMIIVERKRKNVFKILDIRVKVKINMLLSINYTFFSGLDPCPSQILAAPLGNYVFFPLSNATTFLNFSSRESGNTNLELNFGGLVLAHFLQYLE